MQECDEIRKVGMNLPYYNRVVSDDDGWADASKFLPADYDLCEIMTDEGKKNGWCHGRSWDGYKIEQGDKIISWRRVLS